MMKSHVKRLSSILTLVSYKLFQGDKLLKAEEKSVYMVEEDDRIPTNVTKVMKTMKIGEIAECAIKFDAYWKIEKKYIPEGFNVEGGDFRASVNILKFPNFQD
jgi:hypothetical protein